MHSVHGEVGEPFINVMPKPKGKVVRIMTFCDSVLAACEVSGNASAGVIMFVNQAPVDWCSKPQKPTETAVCDAELSAGRAGTEMAMDVQATARALGASLDGPAWPLRDNQSAVTASTALHSVLGKRHNFLSYHQVLLVMAHQAMKFCHARIHQNIADILTKFLGFKQFRPFIFSVLFKSRATVVNKQICVCNCVW